MTIVKWLIGNFGSTPERKEYDKETDCFYIYRSGRMNHPRRDAKTSLYYRYFDTEAEALEYIRQRAENKADQKRVDQINRCGVELLASLEECLPCLGWQHMPDEEIQREHELGNGYAEIIIRARAAIAKAKGLA